VNPIRVHTMFLPMEDKVASYILSNPEYTVLVNDRQMTKTGQFVLHLQYEDRSNSGKDKYYDFQDKEVLDELMGELDQECSGENMIEDEYITDELKKTEEPPKEPIRKSRKK